MFKRHGRDPGETNFLKLYFLFFFSLFKYDFLFKGNAPKKLKINISILITTKVQTMSLILPPIIQT